MRRQAQEAAQRHEGAGALREDEVEQEQHDSPVHGVNKTRLEFLLDGVFAIAMTILVLELKIPELSDRRSASELLTQLAHHGRTFFSYLVTFLVLGVLWYKHHVLYRCLARVTGPIYALHIVLMATAAAFPFCAALLGRYPANATTYPIYFGCIWTYQAALCLIWWLAVKQRAFEPSVGETQVRALLSRNLKIALRMTIVFTLYVGYFFLRSQPPH
jgi:uncharacterized membrane protein